MTLDLNLILTLQGWLNHPMGIGLAVFCARYAIFLFAPLIVWIWVKKEHPQDRHLMKDAMIALLVSLVLAAVIGDAIGRARPFIASSQVQYWVPIPLSEASFPSRHATAAFAMAGMIALVSTPMAWIAMILASLVAFGRVAAGVHYPSDVLAGALLGLACAALVRYLHHALRRPDVKGNKK